MDAVAWGAAHADGTTLAEAEHPLLLALRTGCPQREPVVRITRPGGELRWLQVDAVPVPGPDGTPERVVVSFIDISERVQAEGALRASEERFRSVTESAHDAIIAADGQGTILSWNAGARAIFGYRADEVIGQPLTIVMPERYHAAHRRALERLTDTGILQLSGQAVEMQGRRKDGSEFPLELSLSTWATAEGRFYSGIIRDITDRKQAEEAERARMAAEQASAQKSEFLSRMSHELRTPLNAILGFAQLLELDARDPEQEQSVAQILRAGRHLLGLINEVLDITRIEAGRMELSLEPTRLGDVVRKAHALVLPLAQERGVRWDLGGLADCDCHVRADRQRLAQVLLNLLSNAVKYNWEGGTVALSCAMPTPDRLRLVVRDTGMGIAEHRLGRLFTPFERLGAEASGVEGTGMGLALSRSLVAAMGGVIGVESVEGQGSAFWIELERTEAPAAPAPHTAIGPLALRPAEARRTVLYIEDNLSNLQLTERLFAAQPQVALLSAMQGQRGLELARAHVPDLILLDVHLPDMRGDEVLRRLRDDPATRNIPVVVLSADATQRQKDRLADAGAQDYLTKPLDIAQFRRTVDALLQQEVS